MARIDGREPDQLRPVTITPGYMKHAEGSVLIEMGDTHVICSVSVEDRVPHFLIGKGQGWITAEYSMLPYSTLHRKQRDSTRGRIDGRSQEIQRLIGRSMRAAVDLEKLGPRTIWIDCDVLQADGGTRTASITGSFVALSLALERLLEEQVLTELPLVKSIAAVSVGMVEKTPLLDLCYEEDASAEVDLNVVMTSEEEFVELQGTGEQTTFSGSELTQMLDLARKGMRELRELQQSALEKA